MTMLSVGDSIGQDLGLGLQDTFSDDPAVVVVQKAQESTGLARSDYFNWPAALETDLAKYHPQVVVVMMGANDAQSLYEHRMYLLFGTSTWWRAYSARVATFMTEATSAGAHVMWVGLPPMGPNSSVPRGFTAHLNDVFASQARSHSGVAYFSAASLLSASGGGFAEYLPIGGSLQQVRSGDGVHLYPAGYDLLARSLVQPMERDWHVYLGLRT
jgi:hypothetical protein